MAKIQGFLSILAFSDNDAFETNPVGELSPYAQTAAADPQYYNNDGVLFTVIHSSDVSMIQTTNYPSIMLAVANVFRNIDANLATAAGNFQALALMPDYENIIQFKEFGEPVLNPINDVLYPSSITFDYINQNETNWEFKIWLSDSHFIDEYDKVVVNILPPVDDVNLIFNSYNSAVSQEGTNYAIENFITRESNFVGTKVYTQKEIYSVEMEDPSNDAILSPFRFTLYYHGFKKLTGDQKLQLVLEWLVNNSSYEEWRWEEIIPASLSLDNWFFLPMYNQIAIDSVAHESPIYSHTLDIANLPFDTLLNKYFSAIVSTNTLATVKSKVSYITLSTQSVALLALCDPDATSGWMRFSEEFSDFFLVGLNDQNVNQMQVATRDMLFTITDLFVIANTYVLGQSLPTGVRISNYNGRRWLKTRLGLVEISIITRESFLE